MRNFILFMVLLGLCATATAQKIHFSDITNVWQINIPFSGGGSCYQCTTQYHYAGLDSSGIYSVLAGTSDTALIREDTIAQKVYAKIIRNNGISPDTGEILLYDYSLQPGDTFRMNAGINGTTQFIHVVDKVDTIMVGNTPHRVFHFLEVSPMMGGYDVIEGIGCLQDPLFPYFPLLFEERRELYCFSSQGTIPFITPAVSSVTTFNLTPTGIFEMYNDFHNTNTCALLSVADYEIDPETLSVYPQPASGDATVRLPAWLNEGSLKLINLLGKTIYQKSFSDEKELVVPHTEIPGIYYLNVKSKDGKSAACKLIFE